MTVNILDIMEKFSNINCNTTNILGDIAKNIVKESLVNN